MHHFRFFVKKSKHHSMNDVSMISQKIEEDAS